MNWYEYLHVVGFAETNVVGNVYFAHFLSWQGRCRELFILEHCPTIIKDIEEGTLSLVTKRANCVYLAEVCALDRIAVRMSLESIRLNHISISFTYFRIEKQGETVVATGEQEIACMKKLKKSENGGWNLAAIAVPVPLAHALSSFSNRKMGVQLGQLNQTRGDQ